MNQFFFLEQIYTKVQPSTITEKNKYEKNITNKLKKNIQRNKNKQKNPLPTYPHNVLLSYW